MQNVECRMQNAKMHTSSPCLPVSLSPCLASPRRAFTTGQALQRRDRRAPADIDVALLAAQVDAAERPDRAHLQDVDLGGLLGLVGGQRGVRGRLDLQNVERL